MCLPCLLMQKQSSVTETQCNMESITLLYIIDKRNLVVSKLDGNFIGLKRVSIDRPLVKSA